MKNIQEKSSFLTYISILNQYFLIKSTKVKVKKKVLFAVFSFLFLISCHPSKKEYLRTFDLPLMKQTDELLRSANYMKGIDLNKKYLVIADKEKYQSGKATCYTNLAIINSEIGNYKNSLLFLQKADSILKDSDDMVHKAHLYNQYGMLNEFLLMKDTSDQYYNKALYCLDKSEDSETKKFLLQKVYINKSTLETDSALIYLHKARNIEKNVLIEAMFASMYFEKNKLDSTRFYLNSALKIANEERFLNDNHGYLYFLAGRYYIKMLQYKKAEEAYQKALKMMTASKDTSGRGVMYWVYQDLAYLYKQTGDKKKEHDYTYLFYTEREKFEKDRAKTINLSNKTFIAGLKNTEKEEKGRIWLFIILSGILIVFISFFVYRILRQLQIKKKALQHETKTLKDQITDKSYNEIIELARKNDSTFLMKFQETYPIFIARLHEINPDLESSELAFCCLLKLNFTSKDIAAYTFTQHTSVQQRKRRLRKKLAIPSDVDLYVYFNNL